MFVYFAFEFGWIDFSLIEEYVLVNNSLANNALKGFVVYQNILSTLGMLFFAYIAFRFICEVKNKRIKFIEIMLGNEKRSVKVKKTKELSNGCLEEKPNKQNHNIEQTEDNIIIESEE